MKKFNFLKTELEGLTVIELNKFSDSRGYFAEIYNEQEFKEAGLNLKFVQTNESVSSKGVLRGLHFQKEKPQGKLVRCVQGEIFDVAVDIRENSKTFGKWFGINLSEENFKQFYIPEGFAHGFYVLSEKAKVQYMVTELFHKELEGAIIWNDPAIGIDWPLSKEPELSEKDSKNSTLKEAIA